MKWTLAVVGAAIVLSAPLGAGAAETYNALDKKSEQALVLRRILYPFVATCDQEKDHFQKLFCSALNERLKAQHQSKTYRSTFEPSSAGPLVATYSAKPKPSVDLTVRGCLTCRQPMLDRKGGDITKARFFLFKTPEDISIRQRRKKGESLYDLGDITVASYQAALPAKMTKEKFEAEVLPFLRLDLLFRPVAGVEMVGRKHKYGVVSFELVGHRVYNRCSGEVFGAAPAMEGKVPVDKKDMTCPQNRPKKPVVKVKLPSRLPQTRVKVLMDQLGEDIQACYEQYGATGNVPAEIVVAPSGKVKAAKVTGELSGSDAGKCVERLIQAMEFPKFSGEDARLQWPLTLRQ